MKSQAALPISTITQKEFRSLSATLRSFFEPAEGLPQSLHRRFRLLAWLLLALMLLVAIAAVFTIFSNPAGSARRAEYMALTGGCLLALAVLGGVNRAGHYLIAARLTVACAVAGPWAAVLVDPTILRGDFVPLTYVALPIMLCSLLLSAQATAVLAALQLALLALFLGLNPAAAAINWPSLIAFVLFVSVLSLVANVISRRDQDQIEQQTRLLTSSAEQLRDQSVRDYLTGLFNRRYLEETLAREVRRAERAHAPLGVIMIDLDHFKQFNDTYGHAAGDVLLREMGGLLRRSLRESDIACRYGGEEFTLIMPDSPLSVVQERAERIRLEARQLRLESDGLPLKPVSLSIGVAVFPEHGRSGDAVLQASDAALYRAKREGRDRVVVAALSAG